MRPDPNDPDYDAIHLKNFDFKRYALQDQNDLPDQDGYYTSHISPHVTRRAVAYTSICKAWRNVLIRRGSLWTTISVDALAPCIWDKRVHVADPMVWMIMARRAKLPLTIILHSGMEHPKSVAYPATNLTELESSALRFLHRFRDRISKIIVVGWMSTALFESDILTELPVLDRLEIRGEAVHLPSPGIPLTGCLFVPSLYEVVTDFAMPFCGLTRLIFMLESIIPPIGLLRVLKHNPGLEYLYIPGCKDGYFPATPILATPIALVHLTHLVILDNHEAYLPIFSTPNAKYIQIKGGSFVTYSKWLNDCPAMTSELSRVFMVGGHTEVNLHILAESTCGKSFCWSSLLREDHTWASQSRMVIEFHVCMANLAFRCNWLAHVETFFLYVAHLSGPSIPLPLLSNLLSLRKLGIDCPDRELYLQYLQLNTKIVLCPCLKKLDLRSSCGPLRWPIKSSICKHPELQTKLLKGWPGSNSIAFRDTGKLHLFGEDAPYMRSYMGQSTTFAQAIILIQQSGPKQKSRYENGKKPPNFVPKHLVELREVPVYL